MADQEPQSAGKVVSIPGFGDVLIPEELSPTAKQRFESEARERYKQAPAELKQGGRPVSWLDTAVDWLPTVGAVVGGAMGTEGGPIGIGLGAGAGGALGKAAQQKIDVMRGKAEAPAALMDAVAPVLSEGATDAVLGGLGAGAVKVAGMAAPAVGRAAEAVGGALERSGSTGWFRGLTGAEAMREILKGNVRKALTEVTIPPLVRASGRALAAGGRAAQQLGEPSAKEVLATRLARIPIADRLAAIGKQGVSETVAAAEPAIKTLAEDVDLVRASLSKGMDMSTAIRIMADGSAEYADVLKPAVLDSLKKQGFPTPEAVTRLLATKSFSQLPK